MRISSQLGEASDGLEPSTPPYHEGLAASLADTRGHFRRTFLQIGFYRPGMLGLLPRSRRALLDSVSVISRRVESTNRARSARREQGERRQDVRPPNDHRREPRARRPPS
jgi:hypothetical protein